MTTNHPLADVFTLWDAVGFTRPAVAPASLFAAWSRLTAGYAPDVLREAGENVARAHRFPTWPTLGELCAAADAIRTRGRIDPRELFDRVVRRIGSFGEGREAEAVAEVARATGTDRAAILAGISAIGGYSHIHRLPDPRYGGDAIGRAQAEKLFVATFERAVGADTRAPHA